MALSPLEIDAGFAQLRAERALQKRLHEVRDPDFWRALNPENIGTLGSVSAPGFKMDCNTIRGRSGLPWERKL